MPTHKKNHLADSNAHNKRNKKSPQFREMQHAVVEVVALPLPPSFLIPVAPPLQRVHLRSLAITHTKSHSFSACEQISKTQPAIRSIFPRYFRRISSAKGVVVPPFAILIRWADHACTGHSPVWTKYAQLKDWRGCKIRKRQQQQQKGVVCCTRAYITSCILPSFLSFRVFAVCVCVLGLFRCRLKKEEDDDDLWVVEVARGRKGRGGGTGFGEALRIITKRARGRKKSLGCLCRLLDRRMLQQSHFFRPRSLIHSFSRSWTQQGQSGRQELGMGS